MPGQRYFTDLGGGPEAGERPLGEEGEEGVVVVRVYGDEFCGGVVGGGEVFVAVAPLLGECALCINVSVSSGDLVGVGQDEQ